MGEAYRRWVNEAMIPEELQTELLEKAFVAGAWAMYDRLAGCLQEGQADLTPRAELGYAGVMP